MKNIVRIHTPFIRLDCFLKFCGACDSGGQAKQIIAQGQVLVNRKVCLQRGKKLVDQDCVKIENTEYVVKHETLGMLC